MSSWPLLLIVATSFVFSNAIPLQGDTLPKRYALSEIISKVENDLFKTALSANSLVNGNNQREKRSSSSTPAPFVSQTVHDEPGQVIIDRVVVIKGPTASLLPQIPIFTKLKSAGAIHDDAEGSGSSEETTESSTTTDFEVDDTTVFTESTTTPVPSTTTVATTTTVKPTTTKAPIVQLKEIETDIKEKVAEVEADPIIFSSRV